MDRKEKLRAEQPVLDPVRATRMLMDLYGSDEAERALRERVGMNDEQIKMVMQQVNAPNN